MIFRRPLVASPSLPPPIFHWPRLLWAIGLGCLAAPAFATNFPVGTDAALRAALTTAVNGDTITFTANITLLADLPAVQTNVTIIGTNSPSNFFLDGASTYRGFFVANFNGGGTLTSVSVTIQDLTIQNTTALGGAGGGQGGGGAGLGGAVFVADLASVTLNDVNLATNNASGGGGSGASTLGGGGGMGGQGGAGDTTPGSGGGGLGLGSNGGGTSTAGTAGIATGASSGGVGGSAGAAGGAAGGGGGGGTSFGGGGGGGVGGSPGSGLIGGTGGFGGGGGGGFVDGGFGGFGGGGGAASATAGAGGFGGGGGGGAASNGGGGFAGGTGGSGGGGGGAGLGGALFVQQGGTVLFTGPLTVNGNTVATGAAGGSGAVAGSAYGAGLFIQGNTTVTFSPASGKTQTVSDVIADQTGSGGTAGNAGAGALAMTGAGTLVLSGTNTYTGGTTVTAGLVNFAAAANFGGGTITLNGGGLQWATATTTDISSALAALGAGGGTFNTNGNNVTLATAITGASGGLTKTGTGILTLSGADSYGGGTTVTTGTLEGTTTSLQGNIADNAAVIFSQATNGTYSGQLSGTGTVTLTGAGTVTFTGTNNYSGGTTVSAGILQGTTTSLQGNIVDNAGVTFSQATNGTYGGQLSGTGAVTITGGGTVTFSGSNSYNGGTTVSAGTLQGTTTSLQGNIADNAAVTFSQATNGTYAGQISGSGGVTITGGGALTLSNTNGYTGATSVSAGALLVTGSLASGSTVTISSGATLGGAGTVGGSVVDTAGGSVAPGNSGIGTLSVGGNFTWNGTGGGATMVFDLSGSNSTSDKLAITGALAKGTAGTFSFNFQGGGHAAAYTLMSFGSTTFNTSDFSYTNLASGLQGNFSIVSGTLVFTTFNVATPSQPGGPATVTITLGNLTPTFNGAPEPVTITTSPAGLASLATITYNGSATVPTTAGTYVIVALINNGGEVGVASGTLTIAKATPVVSWSAPAAISHGTALTAAQLDATSNVPGTFAYSPASGTVLGAGTQTLSVTFTPTDSADYSAVTTSVSLPVTKAVQTLSVPTPPTQTTNGPALVLPATTSGGLPLTYTVLSGPATVNGTTVTFTGGPGVVTIQVNQAGDANDNPATSTLTFTVQLPNALVNVSARGQVTASQPLITGFSVSGSGPKSVLVRGIGPGLTALGVPGALAAPTLQLFDSHGNVLSSNTGWADSASLAATFAQVGAFPLAATSADSALVASLQPGNYTAEVTGSGGASGAALAEIYDATVNPLLATIQVVNLSARGQIGSATGSGPIIAGFVVTGSAPMRLLIRGVGPALTSFGVSGALAAPQLALNDSHGNLLAQNAGWGTPVTVNSAQPAATAPVIAAAAAEAGAFPLATGSADAAIVVTLAPGSYTAQVSGLGTASGVGLVEIYQAP